jgi:glycosyltransferase involved in cell wall biosynthesis
VKVGLNLLFLGPGAGGVGRYAVELAKALSDRDDVELHLFTTEEGLLVLDSQGYDGEAQVRRVPVKRSDRAGYLAASFLGVPVLASASRLDILHSPANVGPVVAPGVACVITVHDLIWMRYGTEWDSPAAVSAMGRSTRLTVPRARRIITDSKASKVDLVSLLGLNAERVDVVPLGVSAGAMAAFTGEAELRERFALGGGRVVLCVAQKRPYKGQERLVRALTALPQDVVLVLPGAATDYEAHLRRLAEELGLGSRVVFPEWVSDEDLEGLYRLASCFALASEIEGFGLPVLEAMARALPVACADRSSLPEVAGGAAVLFDPSDQGAVNRAVGSLIGDETLRRQVVADGLERAAAFTWARTAQETVDSYRRAVEAR